jgi:DNA-binding transcriptional regulator YbjK
MNSIQFWASVASPIIGCLAIIVALFISRISSKENKSQIKAIYDLLDVFIATQNPIMMEAQREYEQQLAELNNQIDELEEEIQTVSPFFGRGPKIEDMEELYEKKEMCKQLKNLEDKREMMKGQLNLILSYIERTKK